MRVTCAVTPILDKPSLRYVGAAATASGAPNHLLPVMLFCMFRFLLNHPFLKGSCRQAGST